MSQLFGSGGSGPQSRLAVIVIHGMGEQEPMETLRGFVETAWEQDDSLFSGLKGERTRKKPEPGKEQPDNYETYLGWTEPDVLSDATELRRITTRGTLDRTNPGPQHLGVRADFFELHWADLTADNSIGDFVRWFRRLLLRKPSNVPPRLFFVWLLLWFVVAVIGISGVTATLPKFLESFFHMDVSRLRDVLDWRVWDIVRGLSVALGAGVAAWLTAYFGDVARYVSAAPRNIKVRDSARKRGLKLISDLTASGTYDRIVIVGHSLGSVLAHDLVYLAWNEIARERFPDGGAVHQAVEACERAADELLDAARATVRGVGQVGKWGELGINYVQPPKNRAGNFVDRLAAYRVRQRALFHALASGSEMKRRWLISDLVTIGSPLTHARLLIARDGNDLANKFDLREALYCPPLCDNEEDAQCFRFSYPSDAATSDAPAQWRLHHGSAMGPVRWTNVHDVTTPLGFLAGDLISGPLSYIAKSHNFGPGVMDVKVAIKREGWGVLARLFTHTQYWTGSPEMYRTGAAPPHVVALRDAINVLDEPAAEKRLLATVLSSA